MSRSIRGKTCFADVKPALINMFILIMDQKTMFNAKGVNHGDKPTEN